MALKRLVSVISVTALIACTAQADMAFKQQSGIKLFQHYAQASCLATAFTEGEIYDQAVSALNGYREFGDMPLEAYEALIEPIQQWLQKDYATKAGKQNNLMKCIDFAESELVTDIYHVHSAGLDTQH
ncbi:MAG: T6SS amidase immunity protein Tai4 family protein [Pseudomonadota bacterium]